MLISFPSTGTGAARKRAETTMINLTEMDNRRADHAARVARVNREGWMRPERVRTPSADGHPWRRTAAMLIRLGAWAHLATAAPARTTVR